MDNPELKDTRLSAAKTLIESGQINNLEELFQQVPRTVFAENLGVNTISFINRKAKQPQNFKLHELITVSELLNVDLITIVTIFVNSISAPGTNN